jgi:hypothetical protein
MLSFFSKWRTARWNAESRKPFNLFSDNPRPKWFWEENERQGLALRILQIVRNPTQQNLEDLVQHQIDQKGDGDVVVKRCRDASYIVRDEFPEYYQECLKLIETIYTGTRRGSTGISWKTHTAKFKEPLK